MTVNELREASGMNMKRFAEYFGIPYRTVQNWEAGVNKCPDYLLNLMKFRLDWERKKAAIIEKYVRVAEAAKYYEAEHCEEFGSDPEPLKAEYDKEINDFERLLYVADDIPRRSVEHEPIVDRETWEAVQKKIRHSKG